MYSIQQIDGVLHVLELRAHTDYVSSVAWSPCSKYLATGSNDCTARVWRVSDGKCLQVLKGHTNYVNSVAWSPLLADGSSMLATGSCDHTARVWHLDVSHGVSETLKDGECLMVLQGHTDWLRCVAWSPAASQADGSIMLATGSHDCTARVWRVDVSNDVSKDVSNDVSQDISKVGTSKTAKCLQVLQGHTNRVNSVAWSPSASQRLADGSIMLATGSLDCTARVWRVDINSTSATGECIQVLRGHTGSVNSVALSPCSKYVSTGSYDSTVRVWRLYLSKDASDDDTSKIGECLSVLRVHSTEVVEYVAWLPAASLELADGKCLVTCSPDRTARMWRLDLSEDGTFKTSECRQVLKGHDSWVLSVALSPCSNYLATGSGDNAACVWTLCSKWTLRTHCMFTPAARQLVLHVLCARNRLHDRVLHGRVCVPPLEIWLLLFDTIFEIRKF